LTEIFVAATIAHLNIEARGLAQRAGKGGKVMRKLILLAGLGAAGAAIAVVVLLSGGETTRAVDCPAGPPGHSNNVTGTSGNDIIDCTGVEGNLTISGGDGHDDITGGNGNDTLIGGNGNDKLNGGPGNDKLRGGDGDDEMHGGSGTDSCIGGLGSNTFDSC